MANPSIYVIAAIAGNMWHESHLNPTCWEGGVVRDWDSMYSNGTGGYGLGQWTNTDSGSGMRLLLMYEWISANNYSMADGTAQVAYLLEENYWTRKSGYDFNSLNDFLESDSDDLYYLTCAWDLCWEGQVNLEESNISDRYSFAQAAYEYLLEHYNDETDWISYGDYLISWDEALNNTIMLFQCLNGLEPTPEPTKKGKSTAIKYFLRSPALYRR